MEQSVLSPKPSVDVYQLVTNTIITQLEKGVIPWQQPWEGGKCNIPGFPVNHVTGSRYRGINILLLWSSTLEKGYSSKEWASFKQWNSKNESVRKGEKGNLVVYYDTIEKEIDGETQKIPFLKRSYVFNRCQLTSFIADEKKENEPVPSLVEKIEIVDQFLSPLNLDLKTDDKFPCYSPTKDCIYMPRMESFKDTATCTATEGYYSSLLHELTHWTGHEKRLNRKGGKRFGDQAYAFEELCAELGAAFLCSGFSISTLEKGDHAAYIDHWLKALNENKKLVFAASSEASKAVEYLYSLK